MADKPVTREEKYLAYLTGDYTGGLQKPITRTEKYLYELCLKGIGGDISPEEIKSAVNEYLEKNPVKPGATTEQAQQIEQNKKDVDSLKEDISNKITKFYASSQGETHLADSDNGKIMDMVLYGKSEQKQYSGKNLLNVTFKTDTYSGVTLTNNGDGTYTIEGTNNSSGELIFPLVRTVDEQKALYNSLIGTKVKFITESGSTISGSVGKICFVLYNETEKKYSNETYNGGDVAVPTGYDLSVVDIHIYVGQTVPKTIIKPMITTDLTATYDDFEPYTGGIPSPNPDYPQEIKSVVNPTVKVCGKNLFQPLMPTTTVDGVTVTNNGDGTYTLNGTAIANATFRLDQSGYGKADNLKKYKGTYTFSRSNTLYEARIMQHNTWKQVAYLDIGSQSITKKIDIDDCFVFINTSKGRTYNNVLVDLQIEFGSTATAFEPYHEQIVTLPYTLNAIPVSSGGNVTIDGQQYIADYVDVERGKLVKMVNSSKLDNTQSIIGKIEWLLAEPQEIDLTQEEVQALKALATYYPTTNISVNSKQLDGYAVFNYPISMKNGWDYVKKQLNDNRDYIYNMDTKTQDIDTQAAEAYVNSEYAVALTELEV